MPTVELRFTPLPAHVRTARLVAVSLARRAGVDEHSLDEVRLAVGEAASRAVGRHAASCPTEPVLVRLTDGGDAFVAEVVDVAGDNDVDHLHDLPGADDDPALDLFGDDLSSGVELAVIGGLVEDLRVAHTSVGTAVTMTWPAVSPVRSPGVSQAAVPGAAFGHTPPSA